MDKIKQKQKKVKPNKHADKDKSSSFVADVKTMKENLKITEILRTVKMNSSMRIKAPRGSKVMTNKDFNESEDIFEGTANEDLSDPPSATNPLVVSNAIDVSDESGIVYVKNEELKPSEFSDLKPDMIVDSEALHKSQSFSERLDERSSNNTPSERHTPVGEAPPILQQSFTTPVVKVRERKLSLDHTMLSKRESLSQSEVDLNSIGKSPLERKSSFFRKRMDSFLRNTTEIFKKQSLSSKSSLQRKNSTCSRMSVSMHSLNENEPYGEEHDNNALDKYNKDVQSSMSSVRSSATGRSNSSVSVTQSDRLQSEEESLAGSHTALSNQPLHAATMHNLHPDSFFNSRAISMSSGLDSASNPRQRKASKSNRVTWVASESLTDYFRRLIQDEKSTEMQVSNSYQDFSAIPETPCAKADSKGRRLSYQRAVSGEDPVLPSRYQDSSLRRKRIPETPEGTGELANCLARFDQNGIPSLAGFEIQPISAEAQSYLVWAENEKNLEQHFDWKSLSQTEESRQAVLKELIHTEADHIRHLKTILELYIATAHALQDVNILLNLDTRQLFLNIPDVLNASLLFWEKVLYPMIKDSVENKSIFNIELMAPGMSEFSNIFKPYEKYVCYQTKAVDYLRSLSSISEITTYLTWCKNKNLSNRLQLGDILVKPMQRVTKYTVILNRIIAYTELVESRQILEIMVKNCNSFVRSLNRAIRQREEIDKLEELDRCLECYDVDCRDEEMDRCFRLRIEINLKSAMLNCSEQLLRNVIHQADMRFKDNYSTREMDVRAFILTDMVLICKKVGKSDAYRMIRPKYPVEKLALFCRHLKGNPGEMNGIIHVANENNTAYTVFCLSEMPKDPDPKHTYKMWEEKIREAKVAYDLSMWFNKYEVDDLAQVERDYYVKDLQDAYMYTIMMERRGRERVAAMMHPNPKLTKPPAPEDLEGFTPGQGPSSLIGYVTEPLLVKSPMPSRVSSFQNTQSTSSRNSRLSSLQQSSGTSHEDPSHTEALRFLSRAGSSVECAALSPNPETVTLPTQSTASISGTKSDSLITPRQTPPLVVLQQSTPHHSLQPRSASAGGSKNTLHVTPHHSMGHSMPDLSIDAGTLQIQTPLLQESASEKMYQSHQELLHRNRLTATQQHQYLHPDHRGTSYPPASLTRASLKRGLAFSYSCKNPPLAKMGHVLSQSQMNLDQTSTNQLKVQHECLPSTSTDNEEKNKQAMSRMHKSGGKSPSREPSKSELAFPTAAMSKSDDETSTTMSHTTEKSNVKNKSAKNYKRDSERN